MTDKHKEEIAKLVRQVMKESGLSETSRSNPSPARQHNPQNGPAVLNIFHAGVRKLDLALKQVQQIEETARRSSVYTVESARSWVCGADVKEGAGVKCILDTVRPEGVEKALQKADILVLPTFCLKTAAKVANLICDDQESGLVFTALLQGKTVLAANDGFLVCNILTNDNLRKEIDQILKKLEGFGMAFCPTDQLHDRFQKIVNAVKKPTVTAPSAEVKTTETSSATLKLITAKVITQAVDHKQDAVRLAPGGIITPLARDLAKEYGIDIIET